MSCQYAFTPKELQSTLHELVVTSSSSSSKSKHDTHEENPTRAARVVSPPTAHLRTNTGSTIRYSASNNDFQQHHGRNASSNSIHTSTSSSKPGSRQTSPVSGNRNTNANDKNAANNGNASTSASASASASSSSTKKCFLSSLKDVLAEDPRRYI